MVMTVSKTILRLLLCGVGGYIAEPFCFPEKEDVEVSLATNLTADGEGSSQVHRVDFEALAEAAALREREKKDAADRAMAKVARADEAALVIPRVKDLNAEGSDAEGADGSAVKKPAFPILSLQLDRYEKRSATGSPKLEEAVRFAIGNNHFEGLIALLQKDLYQPMEKNKEIDPKELEELVDNPAWNHALNLYTVLQLFSADEIGRMSTAGSQAEEFYYWLLTTPEALTQLLYNLTPQDDLGKALAIWGRIWESEKEEALRVKYLNLAVACALVFDQGRIKPKMAYEEVEPFERYSIFRKNAEAKRLKTVISNMDVADLVWVVDVPLTNDEIEWAVRRANFSRRRWGKAYGHIEYLMERAVNGENPYDEYSLAQIEKHGGVCGDQTYFSVNAAKANGIPASGVTGTGDRGAHAWLAYKPNKDEWDTTTGRYENYSNGTSKNSQTNQKISEFDFMLMSDRKMKSARVQEAKTLLRLVPILMTMKHDRMGIRQTLEEALDMAPLLEEAWGDYIAFLEQETPELTQAEWQKVVDTIERTFKKHPTMWMSARALTKKHIWKHLEQEDIEKTQSRYRSEIARKFPARGDLIRKVVAEQGAMVSREEDFTKVRSFYRQTMRLYGEDTLNFKFIADQYFKSGKRFPDDREQICDDIESYFSRSIDLESGDFFKAKTEIGVLKTIARYYGEIGNERKAEKYRKEAEQRLKKSSRRAL